MQAAADAGFSRSFFYSNFHFQDLAGADPSYRSGRLSLLQYLDSFLEHHHRVSTDGMAKLRQSLFPIFGGMDHVFAVGDGAALLGCLVCCK
jgi:hypothetical protein